ncbi:MAG: hypothetical protein ACYC8T_38090, partial [Myxococcaceae bacterium]
MSGARGQSLWFATLVAAGSLCPGVSVGAEAAPPSADGGVASPGEGSYSVLPFALPAYQPETSFLIGAAATLAHEPAPGSGQRSSQLMLLGTATLRKQFSVQLRPDWYFLEDRLHLAGTAAAVRFPDLFFGLGPDTRAEDREAYTPVGWEAEVNPEWRVRPSLYIGPSVRLLWVELLDLEQGGQLASGNITGAAGGRTVQLGLTLVWDTRDSTLSPASGALVRAAFRSAVQALGSHYV